MLVTPRLFITHRPVPPPPPPPPPHTHTHTRTHTHTHNHNACTCSHDWQSTVEANVQGAYCPASVYHSSLQSLGIRTCMILPPQMNENLLISNSKLTSDSEGGGGGGGGGCNVLYIFIWMKTLPSIDFIDYGVNSYGRTSTNMARTPAGVIYISGYVMCYRGF